MSFLLFGSLWFWLLSIVALVLIIVATEKGSGYGATATLLCTMALLFWFGNKVPLSNFFSYVSDHPFVSLSFVAGYILCGAVWSVIKWYFYLIKTVDKYKEDNNRGWVLKPIVGDHKSEILAWMLYWPFSLIWTILDQPIKKVFLFIYSKIRTQMQMMSDKMFDPLIKAHEERDKELYSRLKIQDK